MVLQNDQKESLLFLRDLFAFSHQKFEDYLNDKKPQQYADIELRPLIKNTETGQQINVEPWIFVINEKFSYDFYQVFLKEPIVQEYIQALQIEILQLY